MAARNLSKDVAGMDGAVKPPSNAVKEEHNDRDPQLNPIADNGGPSHKADHNIHDKLGSIDGARSKDVSREGIGSGYGDRYGDGTSKANEMKELSFLTKDDLIYLMMEEKLQASRSKSDLDNIVAENNYIKTKMADTSFELKVTTDDLKSAKLKINELNAVSSKQLSQIAKLQEKTSELEKKIMTLADVSSDPANLTNEAHGKGTFLLNDVVNCHLSSMEAISKPHLSEANQALDTRSLKEAVIMLEDIRYNNSLWKLASPEKKRKLSEECSTDSNILDVNDFKGKVDNGDDKDDMDEEGGDDADDDYVEDGRGDDHIDSDLEYVPDKNHQSVMKKSESKKSGHKNCDDDDDDDELYYYYVEDGTDNVHQRRISVKKRRKKKRSTKQQSINQGDIFDKGHCKKKTDNSYFMNTLDTMDNWVYDPCPQVEEVRYIRVGEVQVVKLYNRSGKDCGQKWVNGVKYCKTCEKFLENSPHKIHQHIYKCHTETRKQCFVCLNECQDFDLYVLHVIRPHTFTHEGFPKDIWTYRPSETVEEHNIITAGDVSIIQIFRSDSEISRKQTYTHGRNRWTNGIRYCKGCKHFLKASISSESHLWEHHRNNIHCSQCDSSCPDKYTFIEHFKDQMNPLKSTENVVDPMYHTSKIYSKPGYLRLKVEERKSIMAESKIGEPNSACEKLGLTELKCGQTDTIVRFVKYEKSMDEHVQDKRNQKNGRIQLTTEQYCKICKIFLSSLHGPMSLHLLEFHPEKCMECYICQQLCATQADLKKHLLSIHNTQKLFKCSECEERFTAKYLLRDHMNKHFKRTPYQCSKCGKAFAIKISFSEHSRVCGLGPDERKKLFSCNKCNFKGTSPAILSNHKNIEHLGKYHICDTCGKSYGKKIVLRRHMLIHTKKKEHKCDLCDKSFIQKCTLMRHVFTIHKGGRFECTCCQQSFSQSHGLKVHMKKRHEASPVDITQAVTQSQVKYG